MDITNSIFHISKILRLIPASKRPGRSTCYLFTKGAATVFNEEQINAFESVVDVEYKKLKSWLNEAKKQPRKNGQSV